MLQRKFVTSYNVYAWVLLNFVIQKTPKAFQQATCFIIGTLKNKSGNKCLWKESFSTNFFFPTNKFAGTNKTIITTNIIADIVIAT